jgi:hypothetical protein
MTCPICRVPIRFHDALPAGETCCRKCRENVRGLDKQFPEPDWVIVIPARSISRLTTAHNSTPFA